MDNHYRPSEEDGIAWNDPDLNIDWELSKYGIDEPILSEKDQKRSTFKNSPIYFNYGGE